MSAVPIEAEFDAVSYWYPGEPQAVLDEVGWKIERGSFVVLAGPSGSGKSTMLRCLNGLVPHFSGGRMSGAVHLRGLDTRDHGPRSLSQSVGFVFQDPEAQSVADIVEDDIAFGLEQAGLPRQTMRKRVEEVLDLLGIASLRHRSVSTLSGGERQRVAVASALVLQPEMLVLDEPTSQLDPWGAEDVLTALHRLNEDLGLTIVLAEHRLERVAAFADQMRILRDGLPSFDGLPGEAMLAVPNDSAPPLARLARALGWAEAPVTIKQARRMLGNVNVLPYPIEIHPPLAAPIIEIERLSTGYADRKVLDQLSLTIAPGEFVALMGRNGSGKTTLLRSMMGLTPISGGSVHIGERDARRSRPDELAGIVGYVPQQPGRLLFAETLRDELAFTLKHRPAERTWPARNPREVLAELGLEGLENRNPRDLSVGQRERAALASVLVGAPKVLLLDEPTRGMDAARKRALARILEKERAAGAAIVMATHDVELVAECATRVVLLGEGEIVADGSPRDILSGSLTFATQINKLFGGRMLTVEDAVSALDRE
jgi:energy-coupling factor transport system ATP-binding protein